MSLEQAVAQIVGGVVSTSRDLPAPHEEALAEWAQRLLGWMALLSAQFEAFTLRLWRKILAAGGEPGAIVERIRESIGKQLAPSAENLARQAWAGIFAGAEQATFEHPVSVPVWPYLQYRTVGDDRVRPNHAALEGFAAESNWGGWPTVEPPNGWRCRCRLLPVAYDDAAMRGWTGRFPVGTSTLERFLALGGADAGFPKGDFQL